MAAPMKTLALSFVCALILFGCREPANGGGPSAKAKTSESSAPAASSSAPTSSSALATSNAAPPPDCSVFESLKKGGVPNLDPYVNDPPKFWEDFEVCYSAPGASLCQKAWNLSLAMPGMADPTPAQLAEQEQTHKHACESLPEPIQRCLTAYGIRHIDECEKLKARETLVAAVDASRNAQRPEPQPSEQCACFEWVHLADHGTTCRASLRECEKERAKAFPPGRGDTLECTVRVCE